MDKLSSKLLEKRSTGQPVNNPYSNTTTLASSSSHAYGKKQPTSPKAAKKPKPPSAPKLHIEKMRAMTTS
jgi:hypothetical protein